MKPLLASVFALLAFLAPSAHAASDADVTLIKVKKVVIEESVITIVVAEAKTRITLIRDGFAGGCRSANRNGGFPDGGINFLGFRVVLAPGQP